MHRHPASLLLLLFTFGCGRDLEAIRDAEVDREFARLDAELKKATNVFPRAADLPRVAIAPAKVRQTDDVLELQDLGIALRKVTLDPPIDSRDALFFSETEITNQMYADYLRDTHQRRDDGVVVAAQEKVDRGITVDGALHGFGSTGSHSINFGDKSRLWSGNTYPPEQADHPVTFLTGSQATEFCEWLGKRYQLPGSFRLPTEKEWLSAAYGKERNYPWGNDERTWTSEGPLPVKSKPELMTPDGLYGMWGNVSELVDTTPFGGTAWLGQPYFEQNIRGDDPHPRQEDWGGTHSDRSRSVEWGFRIVFQPAEK